MKKTLICLSITSLFLMSCGGSESTNTTEEAETTTVAVDSVAVEMNAATEDIEKSSEELDALLNDI